MNPSSPSHLTSEEERFLRRLIYFPEIQPSERDLGCEQALLQAGLLRREPGRLVVTAEGLAYFTRPTGSRAVTRLAA